MMPFDLSLLRRKLHAIPEMAFQEHKTQEILMAYLSEVDGIRIHIFPSITGILVEYKPTDGDFLLFRADMDALPVTENTGCGFASQHSGMMHACGHDVHMTILMGLIYQVVEKRLNRNLLFLFQPAEEGKGGAEAILNTGVLQQYAIRHAFTLHVSGRLPVGKVSAKAGIFFAIPQEFDVTFTGVSAHAAFPDKGKDALKAGVEFYQKMHACVDSLKKGKQMIFHVGKMQSGSIRNIIPDYCRLEGTHRTLTKETNRLLNDTLKELSHEIAIKHEVEARLELLSSYDPVVNDDKLYQDLKVVCSQNNVSFEESQIFMTGEDFGFFTSMYPSLLFWLGSGITDADLHNDRFLPDDACIPIGIELFYALAMRYMP